MEDPSVDQSKQSINLQDNNVGNLGDILKHAALLELAKLILSRNKISSIHYIDTHAYKLIATLSSSHWREDVTALLRDYPAYQSYYDLEKPFIDKCKYQCSSGIVIKFMPNVSLHLSEQNSATRHILEEQLKDFHIKPAALLYDASVWCSSRTIVEKKSLLMLVDPFKLTDDCWQYALCAVSNLHLTGSDGVLLVFTYDKQNTAINWPFPPPGWKGPVASIDNKPYFLAVYVTEEIETATQYCLSKLGWRTLT